MNFLKAMVLLFILTVAVFFYGKYLYEKPGILSQDRNILIPKGGADIVSKELMRHYAIETPLVFIFGVKFGGHKGLKAGEYFIPARASVRKIIDIISSGITVVHKITIPEGQTVSQILIELQEADSLEGEVASKYNDGELLPETYHYSYGETRESILKRMRKSMEDVLEQAWKERKSDLPIKSKKEAVILASIVEKETSLAVERPRVAAVFLNRLKKGMKLQADPTVLYGKDRTTITRDDLNEETPYNTYIIEGLPIGPICNPGKASIQAVLTPLDTEELYFVADGAGGHVFAKTLSDHNRNVAKWRAIKQQK